MASLYFTTYGACVYYHFLTYTASFIIMIVLTIFTAYQALVYDRQEIALLGLVGAYGIPFLISPDRGHPELLFLYISIIWMFLLSIDTDGARSISTSSSISFGGFW